MPIEAERLQGFPDGWTVPTVADIDPEKTDMRRYNAIGNAVTVPVANWIATRIASYLASRDQETETRAPDLVAMAG